MFETRGRCLRSSELVRAKPVTGLADRGPTLVSAVTKVHYNWVIVFWPREPTSLSNI